MAQQSFTGFIAPKPDKKGGGTSIKSVQRGSYSFSGATVSNNITIATIDPTKSIIKVFASSPNGNANETFITGQITDATTIIVSKGSAPNSYAVTVYWEVIEYYNVKSVQRGAVTGLNQSVTIVSVNTAKSVLYASARTTTVNSGVFYIQFGANINSSTSIGFFNNDAGFTVEWQVIEFY